MFDPPKILAASAVVLAVVAGSVSSAAARRTGSPPEPTPLPLPHIVASPSEVMVDQSTSLTGTGFPKNTEITLQECSRKFWLAPQDPCNGANTTTVITDGKGRFTTAFKVELCPAGPVPIPVPTPVIRRSERTCYIGEVKVRGIDTLELAGAARITVTYP